MNQLVVNGKKKNTGAHFVTTKTALLLRSQIKICVLQQLL